MYKSLRINGYTYYTPILRKQVHKKHEHYITKNIDIGYTWFTPV
jgi:hypothetical protein